MPSAAEYQALFPFLSEIGVTVAQIQKMAATATSSADMQAQIRALPQHRARFGGMYRSDGSVRMNEAELLQTEAAYRTLLRQAGADVDGKYSTPQSLLGWLNNEVSPNELEQRLTAFKQVREGGQATIDNFYVYAGMDITRDDLYQAIVDPDEYLNLESKYNQAVAAQRMDYATFIARSTALGLSKVTDALTRLQKVGAVNADAVSRIRQLDPAFAQQMVAAIFTGGDAINSSNQLPLSQLMDAFEFAVIGTAAKNSGLTLPTKERLAEIRAAGIDRQKAMSAYADYGMNQNQIDAAVQRVRGATFDQDDFEKATFLNDASARRDLAAGLAYSEASGKSAGAFRFTEEGGRVVQSGFTNR